MGEQAEVRAGASTGDTALKVRVRPVVAAAGKAETAVLIGFPFRSCGRSRAVGGVNLDDSRLPPPTRPPLKPLRYPPQLLKSLISQHYIACMMSPEPDPAPQPIQSRDRAAPDPARHHRRAPHRPVYNMSVADRTLLEFVTLIQGINLRLPRCEGSRARCAHRSGRSTRSCGADLRSTARLRTTWQLANVRIRPGLAGRQGGCRMAMPLSGV